MAVADKTHSPCGLESKSRFDKILADQSLAFLESEEQQLNAIQGDLPFEVVFDSGAADHEIDNVDAPGYGVEPSAGSKAGAAFIAANGVPNRGQMTLALESQGGQPINSTFQVCKTNRRL